MLPVLATLAALYCGAAPAVARITPAGPTSPQSLPASTLDITRGVEMTVTDVGAIGYAEPGGAPTGLGFRLPGGPSALYHAGIALGSSSDSLLDAAHGSDDNGASIPFDFVPVIPLSWESNGARTSATYSGLDPFYVEVEQTIWTHPDHTFAVVDLAIQPIEPIAGFYVGLFADWDIGAYDANGVDSGVDPTFGRSFIYAWERSASPSDPNVYGTTVLSHPGVIARSVHNPTHVYPSAIADLPFQIYWGAPYNVIGRGNLDGSNVVGLSGTSGAYAIALDLGEEELYWTNAFTGEISRRSLHSTDVELLVSGLSSPEGIALDLAAGKMYWTDSGANRIQRANLDGSGADTLIASGLSVPRAIALAPGAGKMYWISGGPQNKVRRANLDGSEIEDLVTASPGVSDFAGIALDETGGKVYWTDRSAHAIRRANLDGTAVQPVVSAGLDSPEHIAVDPVEGKLYWVDSITEEIQRANFDGSEYEVLITGFGSPTGIALDPHRPIVAGQIYWAEATAGAIKRGNLDGSGVEVLVASGSDYPWRLALDPAGGKVYWTDLAATEVRRANLDGTQLETVVSDAVTVDGVALDLAAGKLYWADFNVSGLIRRANLDGTGTEDVVTGLTSPKAVALDVSAGKVYWVDLALNKIQRANLDGTALEDVVTGLAFPQGIALDLEAGKLYWADGDSKIQRANLDGTDVEDVVTGLVAPQDLDLDVRAGKIYWTAASPPGTYRADLDGSNVEPVLGGLSYPVGVRVLQEDPGFEDRTKYVFMRDTGPEAGVVASDWSTMISAGPFDVSGVEPLHVAFALVAAADSASLAAEMSAAVEAWQNTSFDAEVLYWVDAGTDKIQAASLSGAGAGDLTAIDLVTGLNDPEDIALDLVAGKMYWTERGAGKIRRANLDGTGIEDVQTDLSQPDGIALDLSSGMLYWSDSEFSGSVHRAQLDGTGAQTIAIGPSDSNMALDLLSEQMYFTDDTQGRILRLGLNPIGGLVELITGLAGPGGIALHGTSMYWAEAGANRIARAPIGGVAEDLVTNLSDPSDIALDPSGYRLYWTDPTAQKIQRSYLSGTLIQDLVTVGLQDPRGLALGGLPHSLVAVEPKMTAPRALSLGPSIPNPFSSSTAMHFELPRSTTITLRVYDVGGRLVRTLLNAAETPAGRHSVPWDGRDDHHRTVSTGVYFYSLEANDLRRTRRTVLIR